MVATYQSLVDRLLESKIEPKMHIFDNEISQELKNAIKTNQMKFQPVPPIDHRRNFAEKAIQVFKDHFISVLCGTGRFFPHAIVVSNTAPGRTSAESTTQIKGGPQ